MAKKLVRFFSENAFFTLHPGKRFKMTQFDAVKRICHFRFLMKSATIVVIKTSKSEFWQMKKM
jgi:hypothetical protein